MPHEKTRPCLSCTIQHAATIAHERHGYTAVDLLDHVAATLAELTVRLTEDGHEDAAQTTIKEMFSAHLDAAFAAEAARKAAAEPGPKAPTVSDIGHA